MPRSSSSSPTTASPAAGSSTSSPPPAPRPPQPLRRKLSATANARTTAPGPSSRLNLTTSSPSVGRLITSSTSASRRRSAPRRSTPIRSSPTATSSRCAMTDRRPPPMPRPVLVSQSLNPPTRTDSTRRLKSLRVRRRSRRRRLCCSDPSRRRRTRASISAS